MSALRTSLVWIGGLALLAATLIDTFAVIGRYVGWPLRGSIELMQPAILVGGAAGLTLATLAANHARIRLLVGRLGPASGAWADRLSELATSLFLGALLAGSGWIALDLWGGHEMSELLGVPWWLMRAFANLCLLVCFLVGIFRAVAGGTK